MPRAKSLLTLLPGGPPPTVDAAREQLGGRATTGAGAGQIVGLRTPMGAVQSGVVIYALGEEWDVWIGEGRMQRVGPAALLPAPPDSDPTLLAVAADARVFATMREGQRVRYLGHDGETREATMVEKCRYGALLLGSTDKIVAVSFRRLWPVTETEA